MAVAREFTDTEIIAEVSHNENDCSDDDDDVECTNNITVTSRDALTAAQTYCSDICIKKMVLVLM